MKIALIATERLPVPPVKGGAVEIYIYEVIKRLKGFGELTVITSQDPSLANLQVEDKVNYVRLPARTQADYFVEVWLYLQSKEFDIIHIFNRPQLVSPIRRICPRSKIILNLHNDHLVKAMSRAGALACVEDADYLVANSNYIRKNVIVNFPRAFKKTRTVHLGVDTDSFQPHWLAADKRDHLRSTLGLQDKDVLLFAGRLNKNKGVHLILQAMEEIKLRCPQAALVIIGSSWFGDDAATDYTESLREMAAALGDSVIFTGFVPPSEMPGKFLLGDIFLSPSIWAEPFGRVNLEAMATGLPVISSFRGGIPEAVLDSQTGILVDDLRDTKGLVNAAVTLLQNRDLAREMGTKGRIRAVQKFTWERVTEELIAIYMGVTGGVR